MRSPCRCWARTARPKSPPMAGGRCGRHAARAPSLERDRELTRDARRLGLQGCMVAGLGDLVTTASSSRCGTAARAMARKCRRLRARAAATRGLAGAGAGVGRGVALARFDRDDYLAAAVQLWTRLHHSPEGAIVLKVVAPLAAAPFYGGHDRHGAVAREPLSVVDIAAIAIRRPLLVGDPANAWLPWWRLILPTAAWLHARPPGRQRRSRRGRVRYDLGAAAQRRLLAARRPRLAAQDRGGRRAGAERRRRRLQTPRTPLARRRRRRRRGLQRAAAEPRAARGRARHDGRRGGRGRGHLQPATPPPHLPAPSRAAARTRT